MRRPARESSSEPARESCSESHPTSFQGNPLSLHTLLEYEGCNLAILQGAAAVRRLLIDAIGQAGGTVVTDVFHKFRPYGVSGVVIIAESHVTVHTWPEHGYAAVDVFSCSPRLDHQVIRNLLQQGLGAQHVRRRSFRRGPSARPAL